MVQPMSISIEPAGFDDPALAQFLQAHLDDLEPTAPPESHHALDLESHRLPGFRLWVAVDGGIVGTGALAEIEPGHAEIKSMRTDPACRGRGVARLLLNHLMDDAQSRGVHRISLETGSMDFFAPARALYSSAGFVTCSPFGAYADDPHSAFMTIDLQELAA